MTRAWPDMFLTSILWIVYISLVTLQALQNIICFIILQESRHELAMCVQSLSQENTVRLIYSNKHQKAQDWLQVCPHQRAFEKTNFSRRGRKAKVEMRCFFKIHLHYCEHGSAQALRLTHPQVLTPWPPPRLGGDLTLSCWQHWALLSGP